MARTPKPPAGPARIETLRHADARRNIPTAEFQSLAQQMEEGTPVPPARYKRASPLAEGETRPRNADLDPQVVWRGMRITLSEKQRVQLQETGEVELGDAQLIWRGKDTQDWSDLIVNPPPIYIQEKVHPKAIIEGLRKDARARAEAATDAPDLFADFNGLDDPEARLEFYQHDQHWSNRMILGDSLQVMASLAEREGLRGKVQCIYFDPPYGIKFNSNWQVSTQSRDVKDGKREDVSREPEQVKAFRDTWKDGIHSYLTYLRDRLTVARELLTPSGSIFVQIGDENVHRVRAVLDEVFGEENFVSQITMKTTGGLGSSGLKGVADYIIWYCQSSEQMKFRKFLIEKLQGVGATTGERYDSVYEPDTGLYRTLSKAERANPALISESVRTFQYDNLVSSGYTPTCIFDMKFENQIFSPGGGRSWKTNRDGLTRLAKAGRIGCTGKSIRYRRFLADYPGYEDNNIWFDISIRTDKEYIVETSTTAIQRCVLMSTDPGDLVLDPTCGSGSTATVAEQWGRRWITVDTSRVALALARTRLMATRYPYYLLSDSREGSVKEQSISGKIQPEARTHNDVRHGFVYDRAAHVTLRSIANNAEIDVLWDEAQQILEPLRAELNATLSTAWEEWQVPREPGDPWPKPAVDAWTYLRSAEAPSADTERMLRQLNRQLERDYTLAHLIQRMPAIR